MAKITWNYSYKSNLAPASRRYYNVQGGQDDVRLAAFISDHLNRSRSHIEKGMRKVEQRAKEEVTRRARVDTGRMKRLVFSEGSYNTDIIKVRFGWKEWAPYYAPFQEFGTSNGIVPMRAVHTAYRKAITDTRVLIK